MIRYTLPAIAKIYKCFKYLPETCKSTRTHFLPLRAVLVTRVQLYSENMSNSKTVAYEGVVAATNNNSVYIIDVREPSELQETGNIPNSINIPLGEVENVLKNYTDDQFKDKFGRSKPALDAPIIFSCRSGKRAGMALDTAEKLGYNNLQNYQGSWLDWEKHIKN